MGLHEGATYLNGAMERQRGCIMGLHTSANAHRPGSLCLPLVLAMKVPSKV